MTGLHPARAGCPPQKKLVQLSPTLSNDKLLLCLGFRHMSCCRRLLPLSLHALPKAAGQAGGDCGFADAGASPSSVPVPPCSHFLGPPAVPDKPNLLSLRCLSLSLHQTSDLRSRATPCPHTLAFARTSLIKSSLTAVRLPDGRLSTNEVDKGDIPLPSLQPWTLSASHQYPTSLTSTTLASTRLRRAPSHSPPGSATAIIAARRLSMLLLTVRFLDHRRALQLDL